MDSVSKCLKLKKKQWIVLYCGTYRHHDCSFEGFGLVDRQCISNPKLVRGGLDDILHHISHSCTTVEKEGMLFNKIQKMFDLLQCDAPHFGAMTSLRFSLEVVCWTISLLEAVG